MSVQGQRITVLAVRTPCARARYPEVDAPREHQTRAYARTPPRAQPFDDRIHSVPESTPRADSEPRHRIYLRDSRSRESVRVVHTASCQGRSRVLSRQPIASLIRRYTCPALGSPRPSSAACAPDHRAPAAVTSRDVGRPGDERRDARPQRWRIFRGFSTLTSVRLDVTTSARASKERGGGEKIMMKCTYFLELASRHLERGKRPVPRESKTERMK